MAKVSTYLNFTHNAEEAMNFYKSIFGGEFTHLSRYSSLPSSPHPTSEADKNLILHIEYPILDGAHTLMASDVLTSTGLHIIPGNNISITIQPDTRADTDRLYQALSKGGKISMPLADMFWGAYYACFTDKFGIQWMLNFPNQQ